ncbi:MAG: sugar phosphate isomerase/epimerase family protein [Rhizobiaceae bacterium]
MFKINLCSEVIRELDFASQCRFVREAGYDGLEVAPFTLAADPGALTVADLAGFRSTARDEDVAISGLHWLLAAPAGLSITSGEPDTVKRTRAFARKLVAICAELGGTYLVHGSPGQRQLEPGREADGKKRAADYFAEMGEAARRSGITYIVEPLSRADTGLINTVDEAVALIAETGCEALSTMVDCYAAANNGEDVPALLNRWIPEGSVTHVHFNDPNRRGPGQGDFAFWPVIDALRELGYAGESAVEPFDYAPDGPACAARAIGFLRGLLEAR